jgi:O-antigen ligase
VATQYTLRKRPGRLWTPGATAQLRWLAAAAGLLLVCVAASYALVHASNAGSVVIAAVLATVAIIGLRFVGFWIFVAAFVVVLNESRLDVSGGRLNDVRWLPQFYFAALLLATAATIRRLPRGLQRFDFWMIGWLGFAVLTMLSSINPSLTLQRAGTLVMMYVGVFWALWPYAAKVGADRLVRILLLVAVIIYVLSGMMFVAGAPVFQTGRFHGLFGNPNSMAWITALLFPLALARCYARRTIPHVLLLVVMVGVLLLTGGRGAIVAAGLVSLDALWRIRSRWVWVIGSAVLWVALSFWNITPMPASFQDYARIEHLSTGSGRMEVWPLAFGLISQRPWTGYGFGTEDLLLSPTQYDFQEFRGGYFHNSYIGLSVQVGIPAAVLFFLPLLGLLVSERFRTRRARALTNRVGFQGMLLVGLVGCMFESWIYSMGNAFTFPFWLCMMLLLQERTAARQESLARA